MKCDPIKRTKWRINWTQMNMQLPFQLSAQNRKCTIQSPPTRTQPYPIQNNPGNDPSWFHSILVNHSSETDTPKSFHFLRNNSSIWMSTADGRCSFCWLFCGNFGHISSESYALMGQLNPNNKWPLPGIYVDKTNLFQFYSIQFYYEACIISH